MSEQTVENQMKSFWKYFNKHKKSSTHSLEYEFELAKLLSQEPLDVVFYFLKSKFGIDRKSFIWALCVRGSVLDVARFEVWVNTFFGIDPMVYGYHFKEIDMHFMSLPNKECDLAFTRLMTKLGFK